MTAFQKDQEVILVRRHGRQTTHISRVGRKYVYITANGREVPFDVETGWARDNYGGRIFTPHDLAEHERRADIMRRLRHATLFRTNRLSTEDAERILAIIDGEVQP